jgi:hypothetical protein
MKRNYVSDMDLSKMDLSNMDLSNLERGLRDPNAKVVRRLAIALGGLPEDVRRLLVGATCPPDLD